MGYHRAGFEVEGVDIEPQPNYPFTFHQMDALEFLDTQDLSRFDVIHASPPCQAHSQLNRINRREYLDLIEPVRERLVWIGKPYVIENVQGAPLRDPIMLCGTMFGLKVFRHRLFESNVFLLQPMNGYIQVTGTGNFRLEEGRKAMGIDWMKKRELTQAIPPAYTEFIGRQLIQQLGGVWK